MRMYLSPTRYYAVDIHRDLFGELVLHCYWGGRNSRRGGQSIEPIAQRRLRTRLREIDRRRLAHGYERT